MPTGDAARQIVRGLKIVFATLLTMATLFYAFVVIMVRIDTDEEFRSILFLDLLIGMSTGLLTYLWCHNKIRARLAKNAFIIYPAIWLATSMCFAVWHYMSIAIRAAAFR